LATGSEKGRVLRNIRIAEGVLLLLLLRGGGRRARRPVCYRGEECTVGVSGVSGSNSAGRHAVEC